MQRPIEVLYQDEQLVVFNKPAGLLVIPSPKQEKYTLAALVNEQFRASSQEQRLHPCHRLDRDTTGAIIFAKGKKNQQLMMEEFNKKAVKKTYIALVQGKIKYPAGEIKSEIKDFEQKRFARDSRGKLAITRYKIKQVKRLYSIVEVHPITGRTNQIRIHMAEIGHPLIGERKYAFGRDSVLKFRRTALHAHRLEWVHPVTKKNVTVTAPHPQDMEEFISRN
jgi:tRNA pseudouridine32 synthase/23S rRNA pseudouridine746 synthase/23S rRNA pseudouridine1911/1915/1917 synthase